MSERSTCFQVISIVGGSSDPAPSDDLLAFTLELTPEPGRVPVFLAFGTGTATLPRSRNRRADPPTGDHYRIVAVCSDDQPLISSFRALH